jgi:hypothetical protein
MIMRPPLLAGLLAVATVGSTGPAGRSAQDAVVLRVDGAVATPGGLTRAQLEALPQWSGEVAVASHSGFRSERVTGPSLLAVLDAAGGVVVDESVKNARLALYIVATAEDGYRAVVSWGEIDPSLGAAPAWVAWDEDDTGGDAHPSLIMATDNLAGRHVHGLVHLEVRSAAP